MGQVFQVWVSILFFQVPNTKYHSFCHTQTATSSAYGHEDTVEQLEEQDCESSTEQDSNPGSTIY